MKAQVSLRLGLGLTYIYSGLSLLRSPVDWVHFVPDYLLNSFNEIATIEKLLQFQGLGELMLGALLLLPGFKPRLVYILSVLGAVHVALILFIGRIDIVTFRDMGLLGAWVALAFIIKENDRKESSSLV